MTNLPFLRQKNIAAANADEEPIRRKSDDGEDYEMLDAVVDDMAEAIEKKDKRMLKDALEALCEDIRHEDEEQDEGEME